MVDLRDIREAARRVAPFVHRTPLLPSRYLDDAVGTHVRLKMESLQKTGSFKPRGAMNHLLQMSEAEKRRGIVTVSAGNHAQATAYVCQKTEVPCAVVMPAAAPPVKIAAAKEYGAEVILHDEMTTLFEKCEELRQEREASFLHPFDDPAVVAGTGTVGLEIHSDFPKVETVVCGIGGGGLISGLALALKSSNPRIRIVGVEPVGAPTMTRALERGEPVRLKTIDTIADGLSAPFAGKLNLSLIQEHVDDVVLVSDAEIVEALRVLLTRCKLVAEPAGSAALAALLSGKISSPKNVAVVISGGNLDLEQATHWLAHSDEQ